MAAPPRAWPPLSAVVALLILAVFSSVLAYLLFFRLITSVGATADRHRLLPHPAVRDPLGRGGGPGADWVGNARRHGRHLVWESCSRQGRDFLVRVAGSRRDDDSWFSRADNPSTRRRATITNCPPVASNTHQAQLPEEEIMHSRRFAPRPTRRNVLAGALARGTGLVVPRSVFAQDATPSAVDGAHPHAHP